MAALAQLAPLAQLHKTTWLTSPGTISTKFLACLRAALMSYRSNLKGLWRVFPTVRLAFFSAYITNVTAGTKHVHALIASFCGCSMEDADAKWRDLVASFQKTG